MIDFPQPPIIIGAIHQAQGKSWRWNGSTWDAYSDGAITGGAVEWSLITNKPSFKIVSWTGDYDDLTDKPSLKAVATSGAYGDLTGKPTLGTAAATDTTAYATALQGTLAESASQPGHVHAIADVTNLQSALDGKQAVGFYATATQGAKADTSVQQNTGTLTANETLVSTIRAMTQSEYDALTPKDANTIYFIKQ